MSTSNSYDVRVMYTENDLAKVQTKTNLYVQKYGDLGVFHLFKEVAQNSIDEAIDPGLTAYLKSIGEDKKKKIIRITHDRLTDKVTVEDSGRGIPEEDYPIDIVCTKLQSGSKFFRDQGGASSGEFGVGITVVNALSSEFSIATYRESYYHKITFKDAEKVEDVKEKTSKTGKKHGTITSFIVNPKYLGAGCKLPMDMCIDWLELMSYQVDDGIEFHVEEYNGIELLNSMKIKKKPFSELIDRFIPEESEIAFGPVSFKGRGTHDETIIKNVMDKNGKVKEKKETRKKNITLEFAFAYDINSTESDYDSFCNFTKTDEGGVHVDAVEDVLCRFLQSAATDSMTEQQKEKYPVIRADVKAGLKLVVNLSTNAQVQFMGNAKNKIQNEDLKPVLKEIAKTEIEKLFTKESGKLAVATKIIKQNAKARIDMQKIRVATVKNKINRFDELGIPNFIPANNTKNGEYREIFLIEGKKSAAGSMVDGRDHNTQAIFGFRGQTLNPYKTTFAKFMENEEWKNYINVLHCGIGQSFNINKLFYDKIIISTDADIDGYGIGVGIAATHALYLPEVVKQGHLFKVYPPLYHIDDKERPFIGNKGELTELYMKAVIKRYKVRVIRGDYFDKDEFWEFLFDVVDYRFTLTELYNFYKIPRELIEIVAAGLTLSGAIDSRTGEPKIVEGIFDDPKFVRSFMQFVQKSFPEMNLSGNNMTGVANGVRASVTINYRFIKKIASLIPIYEKYGCELGVKEKNTEERQMTILQFLDVTYSLTPKVLARFKGLGESNEEELWETTLNPANRILVQLTMDNIERDMEIFRKLKSDRLIYRRQRKEMIESFKIRYEDLDN